MSYLQALKEVAVFFAGVALLMAVMFAVAAPIWFFGPWGTVLSVAILVPVLAFCRMHDANEGWDA